MTIGPDGLIYVVDDGAHCVYKLTPEGELLQTVGTPGAAADTGYDGTLESVRGGPPFNRPTAVAVADDGDVSDLSGLECGHWRAVLLVMSGWCESRGSLPIKPLLEAWARVESPSAGVGFGR